MKFIDLFAGLGGFHIGLKSINAECVFACELDRGLRDLYEKNFGIECHGDLAEIDATFIPEHDILCAGFPCQPFSKAGKQKGLNDKKRGDLIYEIIRILSYHRPKYFILENVPNFKNHNNGETWEETCDLLRGCDYFIQDFILSPHNFGIPNKRERIFIVGSYKKNIALLFPPRISKEDRGKFVQSGDERDIKEFLEPNALIDKKLSAKQSGCLKTWQKFISALPKKQSLPKFPVWAMEFGATYPLDGKTPYYIPVKELAKYKGAFGESLKGLSKKQQLQKLPNYATYDEKMFPKWKVNYIQKNRNFWKENKKWIKHLIPKIKTYISSWQKLEWNAGDDTRKIFDCLLQFRSSGIRIKSPCSVSSLVLTATQIPVIAWQKRYLNLKEAQKLQGFETIDMLSEPSRSFAALGNAVNTKVVSEIVQKLIEQENSAFHTKKSDIRLPVASRHSQLENQTVPMMRVSK